jgi:hypothetical protein
MYRNLVAGRIYKLAEGATEVNIELRTVGVIDGTVFTERVDRFTVKGNHGEVLVVGVLEVADGCVTSWREYYDCDPTPRLRRQRRLRPRPLTRLELRVVQAVRHRRERRTRAAASGVRR